MPNYVTNRLEINADRETVQNVMDFLKGKTDEDSTPCYIDFNNIIPMPKDLLIEASTSGEFGMQYIIAQQRKPFNSQDDLKVIQWMEIQKEKVREEALQLGMTYLRNWGKYGYPTWYEWSIANWGTKWNAFNQNFEEPNVLWFDTAWEGVPLLIQTLSEIFPDVEFHIGGKPKHLRTDNIRHVFRVYLNRYILDSCCRKLRLYLFHSTSFLQFHAS